MIDPNNLSATAHVTFDDEFNSLNLWNGSSGSWSTIPWYASDDGNGFSLPHNGEQEWYINSNYAPTASIKPWTVSNGVLTIEAAKASPAAQNLIGNYQYTSGEINSYHSFSQTYGYFEMRAELPAGQGLWPAFWLLPENGTSPPELDVMEVLGSDTKVLYTAVHSMSTGTPTSAGLAIPVPDMSTGFHTYGVDWEPDYVTWYFDGKEVYQQPTPPDMNTPMYMLANLAVGGLWGGAADSTTPFPSDMQIDYIRAYASGTGTGTSPPSGSAPANLTANDTPGQVLTGTSGPDTFQAGHSSVVMTGNGGGDTFVFQSLPWSAGQITDFVPGTDKLDLSALFQASGYTSSNPIADGYVILQSDGSGGTEILYDTDGSAGGNTIQYRITDLDHVAPTGLTWALLSGSSTGGGTSGTGTSGQTVTADDTAGQVLIGTPEADVFYAGHNSAIMTGNGGANTFVFQSLPWNAGQITDFTPGADKLDLSALLQAAGYSGSDPVHDGYITLQSDGAGGTDVLFDKNTSGATLQTPITITDLDHVAPAGLTWAELSGGGTSGSGGSSPGETLTANDTPGQPLTGTTGPDIFYAGHNSVVMTGNGGADSFVFQSLPWNAGQITDFMPGADKLDLTGLFKAAGYHGTNPIADGYLNFASDGHGDTQVYFNAHNPAAPWPALVTTLDHVTPSQIGPGDWIFS